MVETKKRSEKIIYEYIHIQRGEEVFDYFSSDFQLRSGQIFFPSLYLNVSYVIESGQQCWKCQGNDGTMLHTLWHCPKILEYWKTIHSYIQEITNDTFEYSPKIYVLRDPAVVDKCQNAQFNRQH